MSNVKMAGVAIRFGQAETVHKDGVASKMSTEKIDIRREDRFAAELDHADGMKDFIRLERFSEPAKKTRHRMINGDPLSSDPVSELG